jgi:hypothetical protein
MERPAILTTRRRAQPVAPAEPPWASVSLAHRLFSFHLPSDRPFASTLRLREDGCAGWWIRICHGSYVSRGMREAKPARRSWGSLRAARDGSRHRTARVVLLSR